MRRSRKRSARGEPASAATPGETNYAALVAGLLLVGVVTTLVYLPAFSNQFLNFDDPENVLQNEAIRAVNADNLRTYFTRPLLGMFSPLVYLSFAIDYQFTGTSPGAYHFTNLLLHLLNAGLVGAIVMLLTRSAPGAVAVAALFAVSPVNVAAVVPISVRSSLLYSCFYLAAYLSYLKFVLRSQSRWWWIALGSFLGSLLSKSSAVVFPMLLLLTDWYLGRTDWRRCLMEKVPFFALSLIAGGLGLAMRNDMVSVEGTFAFSALERVLLASYGACFYAVKLAAPVGLSPLYSYPSRVDGHLPWLFYLAPLALAAAALLLARLRANRLAVFGAAFFLLHLALVLKLIPVGLEFTADRYAYLPSVAFFLLAVEAARRHLPAAVAGAALIGVVALFSTQAATRVGDWRDNVTLYTRVLERDPGNAFAHNNLAKVLAAAGSHEAAARHYAEAIRLQPDQGLPHFNLGELLANQGRWTEAIREYEQALALNATLGAVYGPLGLAYAEQGDLGRAVPYLTRAVEFAPRDADARNNLGVALDSQGRPADAVVHYREALRLNPGWPTAKRNLAAALAALGQVDEAIALLLELAQSAPELTGLHYDLAVLQAERGRRQEALSALDEALRRNPGDQRARLLRDRLTVRQGR